jgi:DNA-binding CsgD family transcriptional regulator
MSRRLGHLLVVHDALPCGVLLYEDRGQVCDVNRTATELLGLTRRQLLGEAPIGTTWAAIDEEGHPLDALQLIQALAQHPPRRVRFGVAGASHQPLTWIRSDSAPLSVPGSPVRVVCTMVDVTGERDLTRVVTSDFESRSARRLERLQAIRSTAMAINASHDLRVTLDVIVRQVTLHLRASAGAVAVLAQDAGFMEYVASVGFRRSDILGSRVPLPGDPGHAGGRLAAWVDDLPPPGGMGGRLVTEERFVAHLAMPLVARGEVAGILELFLRHRHRPDAEWSGFMETLAEQAATAIDAHRLRLRAGPVEVPASPLRTVEKEILRLAADGCSNRLIAERVFLSEHTVKFHLGRLYRRLGVHTRTEAVVAAAGRGWI